MASSHVSFARLENGPAIGDVNTVADLPVFPFTGLRLGDFAEVLGPVRSLWRLRPAVGITTAAQLAVSTRADWEWVLVSSTASGAGLKYLVSNQPDLNAAFASITAATTAAIAAGHGPATPVDILILEGPYTEDVTGHAGINLVGLGARGEQNQLPPVRVVGHLTIADETGPLVIDGVAFETAEGNAITFGGASQIDLTLVRSDARTTAGVGAAIAAANSNVGSTITLRDSTLVGAATATTVVNAVPLVRAIRTGITSGGSSLQVLTLANAAGDSFTDCDITGLISKSGGSGSLRGGRLTMTADIAGAASWIIARDVEAPFFGFQSDATVVGRRSWSPTTRTTLAGAGPFTLTWGTADTVICSPGANVVQPITLPLLSHAPDGVDVATFVYGPTTVAQGTAVAVILAQSGDLIGTTGAGPVAGLRLYAGGQLTLRAERATGVWEVVNYLPGQPDSLELYSDPATGSDANPGTLALPFATLAAARASAKRTGWSTYAHANLALGTYTEPASAVLAMPVGGGPNAEPFLVLGTASPSGLGTRTIASSTAGSATTSVWGTVTDGTGGLTPSAWRGYVLRLTGAGAFVGREFLVNDNDATIFTVVGTFPAVTTETFVIEKPGSVIQTTGNAPVWQGAGGAMVGLRRVEVKATAAASTWRMRALRVYHSACWFTDWVGVTSSEGAGRNTMLTGANAVFPSLALLNVCGSAYVSQFANATLTLTQASQANEQQCLFRSMRTVVDQGSTYTEQGITHQLDAGVRVARCSQAQINGRFETVTAIAGDYGSAAIVVENSADVYCLNIAFATCPGAAVLVSSATAKLQGLQGAGGVVGVPVTLLRNASFRKSLSNSVTGTTPTSDVQIGGNAAATAWATVNAGLVTDQAAVASQFCTASN